MANDIIVSMFFLKSISLRLYNNMSVVFPRLSTEVNLNISVLVPKYNDSYAIHNGIICFVYNNEAYVTPVTNTAICLLKNAGFIKKVFCVPFSNREYPKHEQSQWKTLLEKASENSIQKLNIV